MRLEAGIEAPYFEAETMDGTSIQLDALRGRPVWLSFYRYASCPLCCYRVHEIMSAWDGTFRHLGLVSLTVWQSPEEKLREVIERYQPPFQLISDPDLRLYEMYEVEKGLTKVFGKDVLSGIAGARKAGIPIVRAWDGPATRRPADFLISPEGTIDVAFYGENVGQMIPFEDVVAWASR
jgi:peroxiredoxin